MKNEKYVTGLFSESHEMTDVGVFYKAEDARVLSNIAIFLLVQLKRSQHSKCSDRLKC